MCLLQILVFQNVLQDVSSFACRMQLPSFKPSTSEPDRKIDALCGVSMRIPHRFLHMHLQPAEIEGGFKR